MFYILPFLLETTVVCQGLYAARTPHNRLSEIELAQLDTPYEASVLNTRNHRLLRKFISLLEMKPKREKIEKANIDFHLLVKII